MTSAAGNEARPLVQSGALTPPAHTIVDAEILSPLSRVTPSGSMRSTRCYDWLDPAFGYTSAASSSEILPQFQNLAVGDVIPLGNGPSWPVIVADRNDALVVEPVPGAVSWAWILNVHDASTTRLISRVRFRLDHKPLLLAFAPAVDLPWFVMERKMLHGIRRRAERLAQLADD